MALTVGSQLGPYAVTAKIGESGMGEVYRARDTKLDRDVALKVLPQAFPSNPFGENELPCQAGRGKPLLESEAIEVTPAISPDRQWIAHVSNDT